MNKAVELNALSTETETVRRDERLENQVRDLIEKTIARFGRLNGAANEAGRGAAACGGRP